MKLLLTGGCSFSECISPWISTWPKHLAIHLNNYTHISKGMGSQGNGLISRSIIYQLTESLKIADPHNILVGIVWSGPSRHDFYLNQPPNLLNNDGWIENPTGFTKNKNWIIVNHNWSNQYAKMYYSTFFDEVGSVIYTIEHILRTQWFLEKYNIPYFMSTYTSEAIPKSVGRHQDVKHLFDQINFDNFLPVDGIYEWCRDHSGLEFPSPDDNHPSSEQHGLFTEKIIMPFLQERNLI